jgi:hypothetical protein
MWDPCCTPAPRMSDYVSIQSTPYLFFKQVPIVIGKSSKPRRFKDGKRLPIKYHTNSKAWMMTEIFCSFLHSLDTQMAQNNKKKLKRFSMRTVVTDADRQNILSVEKSYFHWRRNSAKKHKMCTA